MQITVSLGRVIRRASATHPLHSWTKASCRAIAIRQPVGSCLAVAIWMMVGSAAGALSLFCLGNSNEPEVLSAFFLVLPQRSFQAAADRKYWGQPWEVYLTEPMLPHFHEPT